MCVCVCVCERARASVRVCVRACESLLLFYCLFCEGLIVSGLFFVLVVAVVDVVVVAPARRTAPMFPTAVSHRHTELALRPELNQITTVVHALPAVWQQADEFNQPRRACRLAQTPGGLELIR